MNHRERVKSLTIKTKLVVIGMLFLVFIGGLEVFISYSDSVGRKASEESVKRSAELRTVMAVEYDVLKLQMIAMDAIAAKFEGVVDPERMKHIAETDARIKEAIPGLNELGDTGEEKRASDDFSVAYREYGKLIVNDLKTLIEGAGTDSLGGIDEKIDILNKKLQSDLTVLETSISDGGKDAEKNLNDTLKRLSRVQWIFTAIMTGVIGGGLLLVSLSILKPVYATIALIRDVAQGEGDLTQRLPEGRDELGELSGWFNVFVDKLQSMIKEIKSNIIVLTDTSVGLSGLSGDLEQRASEATRKTEKSTESIGGLSAGMQGVAAACEQASTNVAMVAAATEEMSSTAREISVSTARARDVTDHAVSTTGNVTQRVDSLGRAALDISKVTEVITEISEQTNLLALNATIEAARAGDAGKGFAVVANEIKDLARQTSDATQEIKRSIESMRSSADMTVADIRAIGEVIGEVNDIVSTIAAAVEEQTATTQEIAGNVTQVSQGLSEVNVNVAKSSADSNDVAGEIIGIGRIADRIFDSSSQVNRKATDLSELAATLNRFVDQFKV